MTISGIINPIDPIIIIIITCVTYVYGEDLLAQKFRLQS